MHAIRNEVNKVALAVQLHDQAIATGQVGRSLEMSQKVQRHMQALNDLCSSASEQELIDSFERIGGAAVGYESGTERELLQLPGRARLLLVEDDAAERSMFAELLTAEGYQVTVASDGAEGLTRLSDESKNGSRFDALLVDMQMPNCNGAEMIQLARQCDYIGTSPVLAVSGQCPADYGLPLGAEGADCWLPKPISPALLLDRLDQCLSIAS